MYTFTFLRSETAALVLIDFIFWWMNRSDYYLLVYMPQYFITIMSCKSVFQGVDHKIIIKILPVNFPDIKFPFFTTHLLISLWGGCVYRVSIQNIFLDYEGIFIHISSRLIPVTHDPLNSSNLKSPCTVSRSWPWGHTSLVVVMVTIKIHSPGYA